MCCASARRQWTSVPEYDDLSVTSSSAGEPNTGSGKSPDECSGWNSWPNSPREELVHDGEHLGPRPVVLRQRQDLRRCGSALAKDAHVRVAEAVDRLELVADEEEIGVLAEEVDQLALEPVRVLELVHHDRAEAELLARADVRVRTQQVPRAQLEILEVEHRLAVLRRLVLRGEAVEQLLEEGAVVRGGLVERGLLDRAAGFVVGRGSLASRLQPVQVEQPLGARLVLEHLERSRRDGALRLRRGRVVDETARGICKPLDGVRKARALARARERARARPTAASRRRR